MRIQPTATGGKALLLLTVLAVAYFATSYSNLFFLVLAFSVVLGAYGALLAIRNLHRVAATVLDLPLAPAGASRTVRLQLHTPHPVFDLTIELLGEHGPEPLLQVPLQPRGGEATATLSARPRGLQRARGVRVSSLYPFGFVRISRRCDAALEVATHPAPLAPQGRARHAGTHDGAQALAAARGSSLASLRPFRAGDALGDVHWKATARRGTAVVKERERDVDRTVTIVLDRRSDDTTLERALGEACQLVLTARDQGRTLRLCSQDFDSGSAPTSDALLRWLAAATALPTTAAAPPALPGAMHLPRCCAAGAG